MAKETCSALHHGRLRLVPEQTFGNAIAAAKRPNLDRLFETYPYTTIQASGMAVGLPEGQMGNSEVGHTNMGAGRIVYQQLTLITKSIMDGTMKENDVLVRNMRAAIDENGRSPDGPALHGRRAQPHRPPVRPARSGQASGRRSTCTASGRPRHRPAFRQGLHRRPQKKLKGSGVGEIATVTAALLTRWIAIPTGIARRRLTRRSSTARQPREQRDGGHRKELPGGGRTGTDEFVVPLASSTRGAAAFRGRFGCVFQLLRLDRAREITALFGMTISHGALRAM